MRILQQNLKWTTDTFIFIFHTTNVLLLKFRCNFLIGVRIIKEMLGSVASGTSCTYICVCVCVCAQGQWDDKIYLMNMLFSWWTLILRWVLSFLIRKGNGWNTSTSVQTEKIDDYWLTSYEDQTQWISAKPVMDFQSVPESVSQLIRAI